MLQKPKIIAVDDDEKHLFKLTNCLKQIGCTCRSIAYPDESIKENIIKGIRIVFMDINLLGGASPGDNVRNFSTVTGIIESIIPDDNGPYALITWTDTELHGELINYLRDNLTNHKKFPLANTYLDKNKYLTDLEAFKKELLALRTSVPQVGVLLDWENKVNEAGIDVINSIYSLIKDGSEESNELDKILSLLAKEAVGVPHVGKNIFGAINEALLPFLYDKLESIKTDDGDRNLWKKAVTLYDKNINPTEEFAADINRILHFSIMPELNKKTDRGVVLELPSYWKSTNKFKDLFGRKPGEVKEREFYINKSSSIKWVLVQIHASCDHAQNRPGNYLFVLGMIVKNIDYNRRDRIHDSLWESPVYSQNNDVYVLLVNHRYKLTLSREFIKKSNLISEPIMRVREQLLNHLSFAVYTYAERPGIISVNK